MSTEGEHSTETALLDVLDSIYTAADKKQVSLITLDLFAASTQSVAAAGSVWCVWNGWKTAPFQTHRFSPTLKLDTVREAWPPSVVISTAGS